MFSSLAAVMSLREEAPYVFWGKNKWNERSSSMKFPWPFPGEPLADPKPSRHVACTVLTMAWREITDAASAVPIRSCISAGVCGGKVAAGYRAGSLLSPSSVCLCSVPSWQLSTGVPGDRQQSGSTTHTGVGKRWPSPVTGLLHSSPATCHATSRSNAEQLGMFLWPYEKANSSHEHFFFFFFCFFKVCFYQLLPFFSLRDCFASQGFNVSFGT